MTGCEHLIEEGFKIEGNNASIIKHMSICVCQPTYISICIIIISLSLSLSLCLSPCYMAEFSRSALAPRSQPPRSNKESRTPPLHISSFVFNFDGMFFKKKKPEMSSIANNNLLLLFLLLHIII